MLLWENYLERDKKEVKKESFFGFNSYVFFVMYFN